MIRSVCTVFVNSPLFRKRGADAQLLWFKLYMHPAQHLCGLFVIDLAGMALCTNMTGDRTAAALQELVQHGLCQVDARTDLVWLPEMSNQCKGMAKQGSTVFRAVDKYLASLGESPLCKNVCDTLSIPYRYHIDRVCHTPLSGSVSGSETGSGSGLVETSTRAPARDPSPGGPEPMPIHGSERQWPAPPPDKQPKPVQPSLLPDADKPPDKLTQAAIGILAELSAARKRVSPSARDLEPTAGNLKQILGRLRDRPPQTPEHLRHVIAVCEVQARRDGSLRWFDAVTPFRAENIGRYLAMDIEQAKRPQASRHQDERGPALSERHLEDARRSDARARDPKHIDTLLDEMSHDHDDSPT